MSFGKLLGQLGQFGGIGMMSHLLGQNGGNPFGGLGQMLGGGGLAQMFGGQGGGMGMMGGFGGRGRDRSPINVTGLPNQPSPFGQSPNIQPMNFLGRLGGGY